MYLTNILEGVRRTSGGGGDIENFLIGADFSFEEREGEGGLSQWWMGITALLFHRCIFSDSFASCTGMKILATTTDAT